MLFAKRHQAVIAIDQIRYDSIPVIVSVNIEHTENRIRLVLQQDRHDHIVRAEKQNRRKRDARLICLRIFQERSTLNNLFHPLCIKESVLQFSSVQSLSIPYIHKLHN